MKTLRIILPFLLLFPLLISAQIQNLKSMEGTWTGAWINNYYQSTGDITFIITVDETAQTAHGDWAVGGDILAEARDPFTTDITLTEDGFVVDFNSPIWGDISGDGYFTGGFAGSSANCPNPNAQDIAATGTFDSRNIESDFVFTWYGNPIDGTMDLEKQNPIDAPSGLTAVESSPQNVELNWTDNPSNEVGFKVDREDVSTGVWTEIADLEANTIQYQDNSVDAEAEYNYRISAYSDETESEYSNVANVATVTSVEDSEYLPADYLLLQNYPNPFNPTTRIEFKLPRESSVVITVYNSLGQEVAEIFNAIKETGIYQVDFSANNFSSGIYLIKMEAVSIKSDQLFVDVKKMVLLK